MCPENAFLSKGGLTVIDWENAGPAATVQDLGSTLWDFGQGHIERTRAFVDHYRRHGGRIERLDVSVFDTARVVQANLVEFHGRRALDPDGTPKTRERAEHALCGIFARPLTRQLIDDMARRTALKRRPLARYVPAGEESSSPPSSARKGL